MQCPSDVAAKRMPFACSFGAPVLAIPAEIAASWTASEPARPNDRTGTEWGDLGWLEIGGGRALVLGGEMSDLDRVKLICGARHDRRVGRELPTRGM